MDRAEIKRMPSRRKEVLFKKLEEDSKANNGFSGLERITVDDGRGRGPTDVGDNETVDVRDE